MSELSILDGLDDLSVAYGLPVHARLQDHDEVARLIERLSDSRRDAVEIDSDALGEAFASDVRDLANQAPVVRFVNRLIREAHDARASDVHLESGASGLVARFRVDGVLGPAVDPPAGMSQAVISRIKLLADLDIAERRRPQDGRIRVRLTDRELDIRVSTVPNMFGESVVLRLLERGGGRVDLAELGLSAADFRQVRELVKRPHGLLLTTGPTGSGKTTTLYAALGLRDAAREKIVTVEEPVEYVLSGVTQVPVARAAGVTFASVLRSILRQDPDVVMVGEMRDAETAELAVQAALTGHRVFSTLHTNDALGAIPRLRDLGIPSYLIAATLDAVIAQRLVRRTCVACRARGCPRCRETGFRGRVGIFELLTLAPVLKEAVVANAPPRELERLARECGLRPLAEDGRRKVNEGQTTLEEMKRVTQV